MSHFDLTGLSRREFVAASAALFAALGLGGTQALAAEKAASSKADKASSKADKAASAAAEVSFPITIKHALGEITIEKKPERVATIGWGNQDAVLAMGVLPVGFEAANYGIKEGEKMFPWTQEAIEKLGSLDSVVTFDNTDGYDYEAINDTKPDLILAPYSGMTADDYAQLSKIAPVLGYPRVAWSTMWREVVTSEAEALGMPKKGDEVVKAAEDAISAAVEKHPEIKDKTALFCMFMAKDMSKFYAYLLTDPRAAYLPDLGLKFPESANKLAEGHDESTFSITLSSEQVDQLTDVDIIVTYGDDALLQQLQADPLYGTIPAIKSGAVVMLDGTTHIAGASTPTCLSIPATVDEYVGLIADAVAKSGK